MKAGRFYPGWITVVLIGALTMGAPSVAAQGSEGKSGSQTTQTQEYIGSTGYFSFVVLCEDWPGGNPNMGVVCFERTHGDYVEIEIKDVTGLPVAGMAQFLVGGELSYETTQICGGEPVRIPVQPGWDRLYVYVAGPIESAWWCVDDAPSSFATKGTVRATFMSAETAAATRIARSGTIFGGLGFLPPQGCQDLPDCLAWLESSCRPALAGRDPAWLTSIEDVTELADGRTLRSFEVQPADSVGNVAGGTVIQFWRGDCTEVSSQRTAPTRKTTFRIPSVARWMTVAANDNRNVVWTLF